MAEIPHNNEAPPHYQDGSSTCEGRVAVLQGMHQQTKYLPLYRNLHSILPLH